MAASAGDGCSVRGKVSGRPTRSFTLRGRIRQPRRTSSDPCTATGATAAPVSSARRPTPRFGVPNEPDRIRVPSGKMQTVPPRSRTSRAVSMAVSSDCPRRIGKAPTRDRSHPRQRTLEQLDLGHVLHRAAPRKRGGDHERIEEAPVVRGDDQPAPDPAQVLAAGAREAQPDEEGGLQDQAGQQVEKPVDAVLARIGVVALEALLADHLVRARGRRVWAGPQPHRCLHAPAHGVTALHARPGPLRPAASAGALPGGLQKLVELLPAGRVGSVPKLRSGRGSRRALAAAGRGRRRARSASAGRRRGPRSAHGSRRRPFPAPRPATRSRSGARESIASIVSGSRIALVSACGVSSTRTSVWQTTW